jgi:hypothetical protein
MAQTPVQAYLPKLLDRIEKGEIDPSFVITHRSSGNGWNIRQYVARTRRYWLHLTPSSLTAFCWIGVGLENGKRIC